MNKTKGLVRQARVTPRVSYEKVLKDEYGQTMRQLTAKQLSVLLYHFYLTVDDPDVGFPDAEKSALKFQAELNQMVQISTENLERLLFHLELAYEKNCYWNPADENFDSFVSGLINKNEKFERLMCLILKKKGL